MSLRHPLLPLSLLLSLFVPFVRPAAQDAEFHPQSFNAYDSLADAYAQSGERELALKNYRRSLELNPKNDHAVRMLKKPEGEKQ